MKLTAGEVVGAVEALKKLAQEKLPVKGAYWINRIIRKLEPEHLVIEAQRTELIKKHGTEQEDGSTQVMNGAMVAFMADYNEVVVSELEVDCPMVKLELLGNGEINGGVLIPLDKFIDAE